MRFCPATLAHLALIAFRLHYYLVIILCKLVNVFRNHFSVSKWFTPRDNNQPSFAFQDIHSLIILPGFTLTCHSFKAPDGVPLPAWRLHRQNCTFREPYPIILMHGLLDCSASWFMQADRTKSLPYVLASAGYDVWICNNRGTKYSQHTSLDYALDDLVELDQPAIIYGVLAATQKKQIIYIGHSQGSTQFILALGSHPFLQQSIACFFGFGTVVSMEHLHNHRLLTLFSRLCVFEWLQYVGFQSVLLLPQFVSESMGVLMSNCSLYNEAVKAVINELCGTPDAHKIEESFLPTLISCQPGGASVRNVKQWIQCFRHGRMRRYDYGKLINMDCYGQENPPQYDLTHLTNLGFHSHLFNGEKDAVVTKGDSQKLWTKFAPTRVSVHQIHDYNHLDYLWSSSAQQDIYESLTLLIAQVV